MLSFEVADERPVKGKHEKVTKISFEVTDREIMLTTSSITTHGLKAREKDPFIPSLEDNSPVQKLYFLSTDLHLSHLDIMLFIIMLTKGCVCLLFFLKLMDTCKALFEFWEEK